jgi:subtilisin family serine protease
MTRLTARSRWGSALTGALALALVASTPPAYSAPSTTDGKVAAAVRAAAEKSEKITFWVTFSAKAVLSSAAAKATKADKGAEVRRLKMDTAASSQAGVRQLLDSAGADYKPFWISNRILVTGAPKLLDLLAARAEVATIEAQRSIDIPQPTVEPASAPSAVEWGIANIQANSVWSEFGVRGEGIVIANIDTGVQFNHPALASKYRGLGAGGVLDHNYNWHDPSGVCPTDAPCDNNDHGTHTMGTMVGDDGGANQIGVAPGAKWIAAKGCESSSCSDAALLSSGEWIVAPTDLNGENPRPDLAPDVVNNSWGGSGYDPWFHDIVDAWNAAGIFPAFSNGNSGSACNTSGSPGIYNNSYSSGAYDINNAIASFSSRGPGLNGDIKPNLAAPGVNVRSSVDGNAYGNFSGTSMASPHTAGTVALLWSAAPALYGDVDATEALLDSTATDVNVTTCGGTAADNNTFGEGRLNALLAVTNAPRGDTGTLTGTITAGGSPLAGATVTAEGPIARSTTTDANGVYTFATLSVGAYEVTASKYGYNSASGDATVTNGGTATLNLALTQAASATVSGTVTSDGGPVAGAEVSLVGTPLETTTNAAGFYSITAPQGTYDLLVASALLCADSVEQELVLSADVTVDVELPLRTDAFGYACATASGTYPTLSTLVPLTGDDATLAVTLPFPVPLYGALYTSATVSTNGNIAFAGATTSQTNTAIPNTSAPNGALYPLWDDLWVDSSAAVYSGVVGTAPNRKFAIEWRNVRSYFDATQRLSFVAEIGEDGNVTYRYKDVAGTSYEAGSSATIGLENAAGTDAFQYSLNQAVLGEGTAISFTTTKHGVIRGTVTDANDNLPVSGATVAFDSGGSATTATDGTYLAQIPSGARTLTVSKTGYETKTVAVTLAAGTVSVTNVSLRTARIAAVPPQIEVVVPSGESRVRRITITNTGGLGTPLTLSEVGGDVPWLGASIAAGSLAPGASTTLTVTVDASGLTAGAVYVGALQIASDSGRSPNLQIPVKLIVPGFQAAFDSGSNNAHVDPSGDRWSKDAKYVIDGCGYQGNGTILTTNKAIAGTDDPGRFANARQNMFEYRCDGLEDGTYTVELNFAEITNTNPNKRVFDVMIEGDEVLPNLDISLEVGKYTALTKTYTVTVVDGQMNIRFITHSGFGKPIVNALRITHRPDLAQ